MPQARQQETPVPKASRTFHCLRFIGRGLFRLLFAVELAGTDRLPVTGGYVLACNHLSWIDPLLLMAFLPAEPKIHFLAATEYTTAGPRWVQAIVKRAGGVIPVDREGHKGDRAAVVQALRVLRGGGVLGIFPEGRCGETEGQLLPFKEGAASFSVKTGSPIQVMGISGTSELCFRRRIWLRAGPLLEPMVGEGQAALLERMAAVMTESIPPVALHQPRWKLFSWLSRLF
jgi:1-acyl-sn-glycerol-3-phosphate acyltransferase